MLSLSSHSESMTGSIGWKIKGAGRFAVTLSRTLGCRDNTNLSAKRDFEELLIVFFRTGARVGKCADILYCMFCEV